MAKKGENIYQRKDDRWEGKYKKSGSGEKLRYGYVTGASYDEVLRKKQAAVKAVEESLKQSIQLSDQLMFSSLAAEWLKEQEPLLKQTTVCKYRNNLNNHFIPEYGDRHVTEITRDEVDVFLRKLLISGGRDGRGLAANTAKSVLSVLKTVVEYARDRRHAVVADLGGFTVKEKEEASAGSERERAAQAGGVPSCGYGQRPSRYSAVPLHGDPAW